MNDYWLHWVCICIRDENVEGKTHGGSNILTAEQATLLMLILLLVVRPHTSSQGGG